ncbi:MAG: c-type cytochrome [Gammaproteobacteria bacterium]|nr:c-type cytochrome [Gammaproteobacteria bacterium]
MKIRNLVCALSGALALAVVSSNVLADGNAVYDKACKMCHGTGMAGAPKVGDTASWKERIAKGEDALVKNAINGVQGAKGFMPPKGGNPSLSDADVTAAVKYMVSSSK